MILNIIRGMFMAFADSVPGVSGGSVAFVLGFYSQFIDSLNTLVSKNSLKKKKASALFLSKIGIGWVFGFILSVLFISSVFETHIYKISSLFIGFILFSIPLIWKEEKEVLTKNKSHCFYAFLGIILVVLITCFNPVGQTEGSGFSIQHFSAGMALYTFFSGAIAISAMVLPGISGSTLLLIFGLYAPVINGIKSVLTLDFSPLPLIICFGTGVLAGILSIIKVVNRLLKHKRSQLIYFILGLMAGSVYAVIMGPTTLEAAKPPVSFTTFSPVFFLTGCLIIVLLEKLRSVMSSDL